MKTLRDFNEKRGNRHFFARWSNDATTPNRASKVMGDLAKEAKLKHPENMRCTKLRKHLATLSQVLDLQKNKLEQLANHMDHNIETHREYHRLPSTTLLLTKASKS